MSDEGRTRHYLCLEVLVVAVVLFAGVVLTLDDYGLTWDEPSYFTSQEYQREWFSLLLREPLAALSDENLQRGWSHDPYHNPHPPFAKIVSNLCRLVFGPWMGAAESHRVASAIFFAGTGACLFLIGRLILFAGLGLWPALASCALWATTPRVFAHAHFAVTDTPITFFAVALVLAFFFSLEKAEWLRWGLLLGLVLGCALATKFTAALLPAPLVLWCLLHRRWSSLRPLVVAGAVALPVAVICTPHWWHHPIDGLLDYALASMSREDHAPISVLFWGENYDFRAPWTTAWTMLVIAVPVTLWLPALIHGVAIAVRRTGTFDSAILLAALIPVATLMAPSSPKHDGIRLFLHAMPFLALLSIGGVLWATSQLRSLRVVWRARLAAALVALAIAAQLLSTAHYHPFQLSYYNTLIGGLEGAARRGMEITYWMEAFTPKVLEQLERVLPPDARVQVPVGDPFYFEYLQSHGGLRSDLRFSADEGDFILVLSRVSVLTPDGMALLDDTGLLYSSRLGGVPLVRLYRLRTSAP